MQSWHSDRFILFDNVDNDFNCLARVRKLPLMSCVKCWYRLIHLVIFVLLTSANKPWLNRIRNLRFPPGYGGRKVSNFTKECRSTTTLFDFTSQTPKSFSERVCLLKFHVVFCPTWQTYQSFLPPTFQRFFQPSRFFLCNARSCKYQHRQLIK